MAVELTVALDVGDLDGLAELLREYLSWDIDQLREISGMGLSVETYVDNTFEEISLYFPPRGRLLLARNLHRLVGVGFLKPIRVDTCEIKRMYVRPEHRGRGLGRIMLSRLIDEAKEIGYKNIFLDGACYMKAAHSLYRSMGFTDIEYYSEGETDEGLKDFLVYMEM